MENTTTDYEQNESRAHFLRNIRQMKSNAVLLRQHEDGRLESVYVSDSFAKMMEYDDPDEALRHISAEEAAPYLAALQPHTPTPTPTAQPEPYAGYAVTNGANVMIRNYADENDVRQ